MIGRAFFPYRRHSLRNGFAENEPYFRSQAFYYRRNDPDPAADFFSEIQNNIGLDSAFVLHTDEVAIAERGYFVPICKKIFAAGNNPVGFDYSYGINKFDISVHYKFTRFKILTPQYLRIYFLFSIFPPQTRKDAR